ncbi:glycosyltransferase family 4 protein [Plantactinospora sp. WMMB782]|uniref:glycosyltransferase family 4 protein n=1 Tax=Plantactinospora sp. WMMB782 TaxID=3404121 RepID=UPI003B92995C
MTEVDVVPERHIRVLYLTHHAPWPTTSGGRRRDAELVQRLGDRTELDVWAVSRTPVLDRRSASDVPGRRILVFADEAARRSYPTRDSAAARERLRAATSACPFDVVHVEGHYLVHLVPAAWRDRTVVAEHNVESHLLTQRAALGHPQAAALLADLPTLRRQEESVWRQVRTVIALSAEDRDRIRQRVPTAAVHLLPNGADHVPLDQPQRLDTAPPRDTVPSVDGRRVPRIGFLANFGYGPNLDAVHWLVADVFPRVLSQLPEAELLLAGAGMEGLFAGGVPERTVPLGWVDDVTTFWPRVDVVVCPLRIGGGVKVKMVEAVRAGCAIVSTSVGVEGLPGAVRDAVVVADRADEFAAAVTALCRDRALRDRVRLRTAAARGALPTWDEAANGVLALWTSVAADAAVTTS